MSAEAHMIRCVLSLTKVEKTSEKANSVVKVEGGGKSG